MALETIGSSEAQEIIETALFTYSPHGNDQPPLWWHWGYGAEELIGSAEPHHWHRGVLFGFWLATEDEYANAEEIFSRVLDDLRRHPEVKSIRAGPYAVDGVTNEGFSGSEAGACSGEKWAIHFTRKVEYDHRG